MLQVPCLSPPIYGHSHYKKFWLRQNSEPGAAPGGLDMKSTSTSTTTSSSPELPKRLKHRRPQQQQLQQQHHLSSIDISPSSSSGETWKMKQQRGSDEELELSTVENEEAPPAPAVFELNNILATTTAASLDPVEKKVNLLPEAPQADDHSLDHHPVAGVAPTTLATTPPDCLTSKCLETSKQDEDHSSDSDSATSSTSQASDDHEDSRVKSSSFRQYLKRQTKEKPPSSEESNHHYQIEKFGGSPKISTRQAAALAIADGPASPRLGSSSPVSRTCKHCGTMKTPLWRNGPLGPKSLCNACGIRLRKARRNNESPSSGSGTPASNTSASNSKRKLNQEEVSRQNSYKKSRAPVAREKRELGSIMRLLPQVNSSSSEKFGKQVSTDEEEGAVLLMALSCGLVLA